MGDKQQVVLDIRSPKSWDQQPGEPDRWYGKFQAYLQMGPTRTILDAFRQLDKSAGAEAQKVSGTWQRNVSRWRWRDRARAWDVQQRDMLAISERNARVALRKRRVEVMEDYLEKVRQVLDNAHMIEADEKQAREWLPQMRGFLRDLLVAQRQEFEHLDPDDGPDNEAFITADDLRAAQREMEAQQRELTPEERPIWTAREKEQGQVRHTILVCVADDSDLMIDLAVLRAVRVATGQQFWRIVGATRQKFARALRRERCLGRPVELLHLAMHTSSEGVMFSDGLADGNWLSEQLYGVRVMLLAGCEGDEVGDWLGVVPHVISLSEKIGNEDAAMLCQHFWQNIGLGKEPGDALDAALAHCSPVVSEFVVRHW